MSYRIIAKNSLLLVCGKTTALLVSFFSIALVARVYGPEKFGMLNLAISIVALCIPIIQLGLNSIVTRDLVNSDRSVGEILGTVIGARIISTTACFLVALLVTWLELWSDKTLALYVSLILLGELVKVGFVYSHWFESRSMGGVIAVCTVVVSLVVAFIRLCCIWLKIDFIWVVVSYVVEGLLYSFIFYYFFSKGSDARIHYVFSFPLLRYYLSRSLPLIVSSLTAVIYMKIDQIMIAYYLDIHAVGIYAAASKVSEVWYFVPMMLATAAFPVILKAKERSCLEYETYLQDMYKYLALIGYAAILGATMLGSIFFRKVFGDAYAASALILNLHIWGGLFMSMRAIASKWILAEDVLIYSLVTQGAGAITNIVLNFMFIPRWGAMGAAASTVFACAVAGYLSFFMFERTRVVGKMMTLALVSPISFPVIFVKEKIIRRR